MPFANLQSVQRRKYHYVYVACEMKTVEESATRWVSVVCFMHDIRQANLRESIRKTNPSIIHLMMPINSCLTSPSIEKSCLRLVVKTRV